MVHPILKSLREGHYIDRVCFGSSCMFIPLNSRIGLKLYIDESYRNQSYEFQAKAYGVNLGPRVGEKFEFTVSERCKFFRRYEEDSYCTDWDGGFYGMIHSSMIYGFYTDRASVLSSNRSMFIDKNLLPDDSEVILNRNLKWTGKKFNSESKKLKKGLSKIKIFHDDLRICNLGWYKNHLVCIDFDGYSCCKKGKAA